MGMVKISLAAVAAMFLATSTVAADAPAKTIERTPIDGDFLKGHPEGRFQKLMVGPFVDDKPVDLDHVDEYRQKFWETYPDKKGHEEAREAFAQALWLKDFFYLQANLSMRILPEDEKLLKDHGQDLPNRILDLISLGGIDGGIPNSAKYEFYQWVEATRAAFGKVRTRDDIAVQSWRVGLGFLSPKFRQCANLAGKEYQEYLMERDWAEFDAKNLIPDGYNDKRTYGIYLYCRFGKLPFGRARDTYESMVSALTWPGHNGRAIVEDAAEQVLRAEKTSYGDLVVKVPDPVMKGPGGEQLPDYTVPMPPGVIGVYSSQTRAMEILATKDDDRAYLISLLKGYRYTIGKSALKDGTTSWTFAANACDGLVHAFGEKPVMEAARAVRTAIKRQTSNTIMDQKAIGATRNEPIEAFEDIMARKDLHGFVLATLAFYQNFDSPASVDLETTYRKFATESGGEDKVLDAAKRIATAKPHLGFKFEVDELKREIQTPTVVVEPTLIDFADYLAWKKFVPGTKVTYMTRSFDAVAGATQWTNRPQWRESFLLRSVMPDQAMLWRTETVYDTRTGTAHAPRDTEIAYPAKIPKPDAAATQRVAAAERYALFGRYLPPGTPAKTESGEESLRICGREIHTHWTSASGQDGLMAMTVKTWTSDQVPKGLVRKTEDKSFAGDARHPPSRSVTETVLESIEGFAPGTAVADSAQRAPSVPADLPPLPTYRRSTAAAPNAPAPTTTDPRTAAAQSNGQQPGAPQPRPAPQPPRRPTPSERPDQSAQLALIQRYSSLMQRSSQARGALIRMERTRSAAETPAEVRDARTRLDAQSQGFYAALRTRDTAQAEQNLQSMEEALAVIEAYVKQ